MTKEKEKLEAIQLRKRGLSYNEILRKVPVRKSTLSVWLRDVGMAKRYAQRFTAKRRLAQLKAQEACRGNRIIRQEKVIESAKEDFKNLSKNDLWLAGVMLYWAEGTKQKVHNISQRVSFANSDPEMVIIFHKWLKECCKIPNERIYYCVYIHKSANIEDAKKFWSNLLNTKIENVYLKNHNPKTKRKNIGNEYHGLLRMDIRKNTDLNRKIRGWVLGITEQFHLI